VNTPYTIEGRRLWNQIIELRRANNTLSRAYEKEHAAHFMPNSSQDSRGNLEYLFIDAKLKLNESEAIKLNEIEKQRKAFEVKYWWLGFAIAISTGMVMKVICCRMNVATRLANCWNNSNPENQLDEYEMDNRTATSGILASRSTLDNTVAFLPRRQSLGGSTMNIAQPSRMKSIFKPT